MSAQRVESTKRAPYFTSYTEVEIDISPEDLESAGWVYMGKGTDEQQPTTETVLETVRRWHDDSHGAPWRWCDHPLCDELRGRSHA